MNTPKSQTSFLVIILSLGLLVSVSAAVFLLIKQTQARASLERMVDANHALRAQTDTKDKALSELQALVKQLQDRPVAVPLAPTESPELKGQVDQIFNVQTQTLTLLRAVAEKLDVAETPELQLKKMRVGIAMLEDAFNKSEKAMAEQKAKVVH